MRFAFGKTGKERGCGRDRHQKGLVCVLLCKTEDRPVCGLVSRLPLAAWIEPFESLPSIKQNLGYTEVYPRFWYARRDSNPQPSEPESDALSIEPLAHISNAQLL